ncbi:MAG: lysozyme inhibitor LprI family protein [Eubacteriales bacterium]|nr:lysozyme inhibitor LprI family protein [Eubacteriales bacterium]
MKIKRIWIVIAVILVTGIWSTSYTKKRVESMRMNIAYEAAQTEITVAAATEAALDAAHQDAAQQEMAQLEAAESIQDFAGGGQANRQRNGKLSQADLPFQGEAATDGGAGALEGAAEAAVEDSAGMAIGAEAGVGPDGADVAVAEAGVSPEGAGMAAAAEAGVSPGGGGMAAAAKAGSGPAGAGVAAAETGISPEGAAPEAVMKGPGTAAAGPGSTSAASTYSGGANQIPAGGGNTAGPGQTQKEAYSAAGGVRTEVKTENPYRNRLEELDAQIEKKRAASDDTTANYLKTAAENERKLWDAELNRIIDKLEEQFSAEEKEAFFKEQKEWIRDRENTAVTVSKKQSGSAMEEVEYNISLAETTRARAYELAELYGSVLSEAD